MNIIICTDARGGMLFNNRRVSRDGAVSEDILYTVRGERLFIKPYSMKLFEPLFDRYDMPTVCDDPLGEAGDGEWCFIEDEDITPHLDRVERLLIYNWGSRYPYDLCFDPEHGLCGFKLSEKRKFAGVAHDEITRELYRPDHSKGENDEDI